MKQRHHSPRPNPSRRLATVAALATGALLLTACAPWRMWTAADLAREARPYTAQPAQPVRRILVVGDSTAVGTGADAPQDSLPGRIGQDHPRWHIDNLAANGARYADVAAQLEQAPAGYDLVLVLAGGNDVIRLTALDTLGHAPFFAPPVSWVMSHRSEALHAAAQDIAAARQVRYVRLLKPRSEDPFVLNRKALNAADGLHPSSAGYQEWYRELVAQGALAGLGE